MKHKAFIWLSVLALPLSLFGESQTSFSVRKIGELPPSYSGTPHPGLAGAFSGISEDKLIIAGGANFPDKKPWEGGIKSFNDRIYIYAIAGDSLQLIDRHWSLPNEVAYGASVTLPEGVLTIGGNDQEKCFSEVRLLKWNTERNNLETENYPPLPVPLSYASAVLLHNSVYVIGGSCSPDSHDTGNYFLKLDLSKKNTANFNWEQLPPFPGNGRIFTVATAQSNGKHPCIYLFSGRNVSEQKGITVFQDGLIYDPKLKTWESIATTDSLAFPVMAGTAFAGGKSEIILIGGAPANLLYKEVNLKKQLQNAIGSRNANSIAGAKEALISFYTDHHGFSKDILVYNTQTKTLSSGGRFDGLCPVTTNAIPYKRGAIITSGEIRPGIRTPEIFQIGPVKKAAASPGSTLLASVIGLAGLAVAGFMFLTNKRKRLALKS